MEFQLENNKINQQSRKNFSSQMRNSHLIKNEVTKVYPQSIPQKFKDYIDQFPSDHPLNLQFIPNDLELNKSLNKIGLYDPIADGLHSKGSGIIHRYKSRVLFTPTTVCPIQCRYCFRKNELANNDEIFNRNLSKLLEYLNENQDIKEVILTGGDPLILSNKKLFEIFEALLGHVDFIRIHTRTPIIIPERIDDQFIENINYYSRKFKIITLAIHTNHTSELYPEVRDSIEKLSSQNINLISQTVLLKNINDNTKTLSELFEKLSILKVKPYYLHHPDIVKGAMHFYVPLKIGREIYSKLREELSGFMIPHYVIDPSDGGGKAMAFNSEHFDYQGSLLDRFGQSREYNLS